MLNKILFLFILVISISARANSDNKELELYANELIKESFAILKNKNETLPDKVKEAEHLMSQNMDLEWMAKFVLGRFRRQISSSQMDEFIPLYSKFVLRNYSSALKNYRNQEVSIQVINRLGENMFVCKTILLGKDMNPIRMDYLIRDLGNGKFKVFDIVTEGVSLINSHQAEFANILSNKGFDALIETLKKRIGNK